MRLLVVCGAPPPSSVNSPVGVTRITPQPPGPGFPFAAPSAKTTIGISGMAQSHASGVPRAGAQARPSHCMYERRSCRIEEGFSDELGLERAGVVRRLAYAALNLPRRSHRTDRGREVPPARPGRLAAPPA